MQKNRSRSRGFLFQKLYSMCFNELHSDSFQTSFYDGKFTFEIDEDYIAEMIDIIKTQEAFFIEVLKTYSPRYEVSRMSVLYILPIYIGLAEMFFLKEEIPAKVSLNEAIEVTKMYGDDSAKKMVNGVLNSALKDVEKLQSEIKKERIKKESIFI